MFASQQIPLPVPDTLPKREWIAPIERREMTWRIIGIVAMAGVVLIVGTKLWKGGYVLRVMG